MAKKPMHEVYEKTEQVRKVLRESGFNCMEVLEDKIGILVERYWYVRGDGEDKTSRNVILFSTPHWYDVFEPVTDDKTDSGLFEAIKALTKK